MSKYCLYEILILIFHLREYISKPMKYEKQRMYLVNTPISCGLSISFHLCLVQRKASLPLFLQMPNSFSVVSFISYLMVTCNVSLNPAEFPSW